MSKAQLWADGSIVWWCLGCDMWHRVDERWEFSGGLDNPTLRPSVLTRLGNDKTCHCFIRDGRIEFLPDSTHKLAGHTVEMQDVTEEADDE